MGGAVVADLSILADHAQRHPGAHTLVGAQRPMQNDVTHLHDQSAATIKANGGAAVARTRGLINSTIRLPASISTPACA